MKIEALRMPMAFDKRSCYVHARGVISEGNLDCQSCSDKVGCFFAAEWMRGDSGTKDI